MITRLLYLAIVIAAVWLLGIGMYAQHAQGFKACGLLILTRYALVFTAVFGVFAITVNAGKIIRWTMSGMIGLISLFGACLSAHQLWPRHVPAPASFGVSSDALIQSLPLADVLPRFFLGTGDCGAMRWKFIGFSLPEWSAAFFLAFIVLAVVAARRD